MPRLITLAAWALGALAVYASTLAGMFHWCRFLFSRGELPHLWTASTLLAGFVTFALPLLTIIATHEYGHWRACRKHHIRTLGPFALPFPMWMTGTVGAFLVLLDKPASRQASWEIASRGLWAGALVAWPLMVAGLWLSHPGHRAPALQADPLLMRVLGSQGLVLHPLALAGRFGLWLTALNALPVWPLDGWRVVRAAYGRGVGVLEHRAWKVAAVAALGVACWPF